LHRPKAFRRSLRAFQRTMAAYFIDWMSRRIHFPCAIQRGHGCAAQICGPRNTKMVDQMQATVCPRRPEYWPIPTTYAARGKCGHNMCQLADRRLWRAFDPAKRCRCRQTVLAYLFRSGRYGNSDAPHVSTKLSCIRPAISPGSRLCSPCQQISWRRPPQRRPLHQPRLRSPKPPSMRTPPGPP
jgi:hypothetical protein